MITRKDYMAQPSLHHAYYSQFAKVTTWLQLGVLANDLKKTGALIYGEKNYIKLEKWDYLPMAIDRAALTMAGDFATKAVAVCIKKAAVLNFLLAQGRYNYAVTSIKTVGTLKHQNIEFFETHEQAFEFYTSLTDTTKGVYAIYAPTEKIEPINVSGNFFRGDSLGLVQQLALIIKTANEGK
jgi:hypothetical protein